MFVDLTMCMVFTEEKNVMNMLRGRQRSLPRRAVVVTVVVVVVVVMR